MRATQIFPPNDLFFGSAQVLESLFGVQKHLEGARGFAFLPIPFCSARVLESPFLRRNGELVGATFLAPTVLSDYGGPLMPFTKIRGGSTPFCCDASIPLQRDALEDESGIMDKNHVLPRKREDTMMVKNNNASTLTLKKLKNTELS